MTPKPTARRNVRPRDAASLLIYRYRYRSGALEVLMGRRRAAARFLPNQYVFPGGGVEAGDYQPQAQRATIALMSPVPDPHTLGIGRRTAAAWALCRAAAREAEEETGLCLRDRAGLQYLGRAITPAFSPVRYHARFFSAPLEAFTGVLGGDGELLDLRWIAAADVSSVPMIDVTALMLDALVKRQQNQCPGWLRVSYVGEALRLAHTDFGSVGSSTW